MHGATVWRTPRESPRLRQRALLVVLLLLAVQLVWLARPAYACGCGALVHDSRTTLSVNRETSAVRWDGKTEQIVMSLTVDGTAPDAAWIMPVPHRAEVKLGDRSLFDQLAGITAPVVKTRHYFWPRGTDWPLGGSGGGDGAAAPAPGSGRPSVGVVGRERLGPFDVARLTADDPGALRDWLKANGFHLPGALATELRPYVNQHWEYVAVRLAPAKKGTRLYGTLDPLRLTFASDRLVYPMRLSRLATTPQSLTLYVFASHRMEPRDAIGGSAPSVFYAGEPAPQGAVGRLTDGRTMFLTAIAQDFLFPHRITGDHELRRTAADSPYQRVTYQERILRVGGVPAWILTVGGGLLLVLLLLTTVTLLVRGSKRRRDAALPPPPVHVPPPLA
ncbi:DUF2330 domain-containing protein [Streptomyces sp. MST-110588]|uniref:DUF2330 domain-containing protein n=1 Tax=Streptomyces sp. MST-110588 TaxID=2833628 RepID=UPI001F5C1FD1|nr:DUF2330 domain-containing protein [Streptomyces sp. MST-110588]UNO42318.1 DUF2330 domain-containing protein [Streptomyces sp. MST-110588]